MATRDERHSTRGRSRLLFEMLEGNPLRDGWRDHAVKDALDLCLACKGCRSECPVNVDMATYKAEFLSHYYDHHVRPASAYAFGLMYWWARAASHMPRLTNFLTQTPGFSNAAKAMVSMAPARRIPRFAPETFRRWFQRRGPRNVGKPRVILWADTWNNHFHPATAQAATAVLEAAGCQVTIPTISLCCGRPLYDYGMLGLAKRLLQKILHTLRSDIQRGVYVVGLEPSCVSVFRDELVNLVPNDEDAKRLKAQTFLLSEFLAHKAPAFDPPRLSAKAVVHGHCHQKSVLGFGDEKAVLDTLGLEYRVLDSGCCGMAGAFGFERGEHYDVSIACGERVLLPAVRAAPADTLIVANGFSCREQIAQTTDREAVHLAQVIKMALDQQEVKHA
jgi:Fe-S oxidoreductase